MFLARNWKYGTLSKRFSHLAFSPQMVKLSLLIIQNETSVRPADQSKLKQFYLHRQFVDMVMLGKSTLLLIISPLFSFKSYFEWISCYRTNLSGLKDFFSFIIIKFKFVYFIEKLITFKKKFFEVWVYCHYLHFCFSFHTFKMLV